MRILDQTNDTAMRSVMVLLTRSELLELKGFAECMLSNEDCTHAHIDDVDYAHELTIARYGDGTEEEYAQRVRELIENDR